MNIKKAKSEIEDYLINSGESVDEWSVERMAEIVAADYPEATSIDDIDPDDFTGLMEEWCGKVANEVGKPIDFEAACAYMDDELREAVCDEGLDNQGFIDRYNELHREKYGDDFEPYKRNGQW